MTQYFFPVETGKVRGPDGSRLIQGIVVGRCGSIPRSRSPRAGAPRSIGPGSSPASTRTARAPARAARVRCAGSPSSPNHPRSAPFSPTSGNRRHQRPTPAIPSIRPGTDHPARGVASPLTARVPHLGATIPATRQFRCTCVPAHPRSRSRSRLTHRRRALPPSASPHTGSRPLPARPEHAAARLPLDRNCRFDFLSIDNFGYVYGLMGLPRTYGVEATWRF